MRRILLLIGMALVTLILLYLSRFWVWQLWDRDTLPGLPPRGGFWRGGCAARRWPLSIC